MCSSDLPQDLRTFLVSKLDWAEPGGPDHARLLDWYRQLIALRRAVPDLRSGDRSATSLTFLPPSDPRGPYDGWLVVGRGAARVVVNLAGRALDVPVAAPQEPVSVRAAWAPGTQVGTVEGAVLPVRVPARSVVVLA